MSEDLWDHLGAARRGSRDPYLARLAEMYGGRVGTTLLNTSEGHAEVTGLTPMPGDVAVFHSGRVVEVYQILSDGTEGLALSKLRQVRGESKIGAVLLAAPTSTLKTHLKAIGARMWRPVVTVHINKEG